MKWTDKEYATLYEFKDVGNINLALKLKKSGFEVGGRFRTYRIYQPIRALCWDV